jgi:hypothetical protein
VPSQSPDEPLNWQASGEDFNGCPFRGRRLIMGTVSVEAVEISNEPATAKFAVAVDRMNGYLFEASGGELRCVRSER